MGLFSKIMGGSSEKEPIALDFEDLKEKLSDDLLNKLKSLKFHLNVDRGIVLDDEKIRQNLVLAVEAELSKKNLSFAGGASAFVTAFFSDGVPMAVAATPDNVDTITEPSVSEPIIESSLEKDLPQETIKEEADSAENDDYSIENIMSVLSTDASTVPGAENPNADKVLESYVGKPAHQPINEARGPETNTAWSGPAQTGVPKPPSTL